MNQETELKVDPKNKFHILTQTILLYAEPRNRAKVLKIQKKILSPNHSLLAITNYNIAKALAGLCEYKKSIEYASQAVNIARHTFGSNHENVQLYENYVKKLRRRTLINVVPNGAVYE
ncbi:unnamed protein product [Adineta steineri]|uniref:Tetratricopeptide repeat protein n=1 Tax=Adineta steineri TaxID=433720 RepID=A0A814YW16_9BILA|nr:unnamed protein product [Adineta steineri]